MRRAHGFAILVALACGMTPIDTTDAAVPEVPGSAASFFAETPGFREAGGVIRPVRAQEPPRGWLSEWPDTDFDRAAIDFSEIRSGGPPKDGIPSIDDPVFKPVAEADLADRSPVMGVVVNGDARAYPLSVMMWHEIVNDTVGGVPVAVTFCPLCNAGLVFERTIDGAATTFGTTGKLRKSDLVMYDRATESWWQQFTGTAIVGERTGMQLDVLPSRLESFASFRARAPEGQVLQPPSGFGGLLRDYGRNPYRGYDSLNRPFLFAEALPDAVPAMMRVVRVGNRAWSLPLLRAETAVETDDGLRLAWAPGKASALDTARIDDGRDVGQVTVQRRVDGVWQDAVHEVVFAFVFYAFREPGAVLFTEDGTLDLDDPDATRL